MLLLLPHSQRFHKKPDRLSSSRSLFMASLDSVRPPWHCRDQRIHPRFLQKKSSISSTALLLWFSISHFDSIDWRWRRMVPTGGDTTASVCVSTFMDKGRAAVIVIILLCYCYRFFSCDCSTAHNTLLPWVFWLSVYDSAICRRKLRDAQIEWSAVVNPSCKLNTCPMQACICWRSRLWWKAECNWFQVDACSRHKLCTY